MIEIVGAADFPNGTRESADRGDIEGHEYPTENKTGK